MGNSMEILAIRFSGMGDIVMLLPTLQKLKQKYANSHITLLCDSTNSDIAYNSGGLIDSVVTINRKVFKEKRFFSILKEIRNVIRLRKRSFDVIIDFQNFGETAFITHLCHAQEKRGAPKKKSTEYAYTTHIVRDQSGHRSQFFSRIAGVSDTLDFPQMVLSPVAEAYATRLMTKMNPDKKTIGMNIGSTQESRRWAENNFAAMATSLSPLYNVVVFAGEREKKYLSAFGNDVIRISDVSLDELCGAIGLCHYFISNDTGPVHIAAALGVPTLTFFSTGTDENVGALTPYKVSLSNAENINAITVEEAMEKLNTLISQK